MCVWEKMRENHTKCVKLDRSVCAQQKNKEFMEYSHYAKRNVSKNLSLLSLLRMKSTLKANSFFTPFLFILFVADIRVIADINFSTKQINKHVKKGVGFIKKSLLLFTFAHHAPA